MSIRRAIVLDNTSDNQLRLIIKEMDQRYNEITTLWNKAQDEADCTDQIDPDLDNLFHAMTNFMMDLELEGME